jgi:hypothetical protein
LQLDHWIWVNVAVPQTKIDALNESDRSRFEKHVHRARNYLRNEGLTDDPERGV